MRLAFWRRGAEDAEKSQTEGVTTGQSKSEASGSASTSSADVSTEASQGGVTLRIPVWILKGVAGAAVLVLVAFGVWYFAIRDTGPSEAEKRAEAARKAQAARQAQAAAAAAECQQQLGGLLSAEQDLDGRLGGSGMTEADYISKVGDISAAYAQTPIKSLEASCLVNVGVELESAMNAYIDASNTWNNCVTDFSCDVDSITPELQDQWAKATRLINQAEQGMSRIQAP